ncbi:MAG: Tad domain-containing protein [Pseudomonadota bacterium]
MLRLRKRSKDFAKEEEGSLLVFSVVVFMTFFAAAGMGVDFIRHELYRAELQNSLDRGLLAATAFSQNEDPAKVVEDFIVQSHKWDSTNGKPKVTVKRTPADKSWFDEAVAERTIEATAQVQFNTQFLKLLGISSMGVNVASNATQSRKSVEVAIVLDISLSMDGNDKASGKEKYYGMQTAANNFINDILTPETMDATAITLVPFAGTVNPGDFQQHMNLTATSLPSWVDNDLVGFPVCPEFQTSDFDTDAADKISMTDAYTIQPWFKMYNSFPGSTGMVRWGNCPEAAGGIVAYSNSADDLTGAINSLPMYGGTGIDMAMKWALYALSPNARTTAAKIIKDKGLEDNFKGWPLNYDDPGAEKYIVFLTDGEITNLSSIKSSLLEGTVADLEDRDGFENNEEKQEVIDHITSHIGEDGRLADYWASPNADFHLNGTNYSRDRMNIVGGSGNINFDGEHKNGYIRGAQRNRWNQSAALQHVENVCGYMKADSGNGTPRVRVFTIGFNIPGLDDPDFVAPASASDATNDTRAAFVLDYCATYQGDRYLATSATLERAFDDIAAKINTLRLTN